MDGANYLQQLRYLYVPHLGRSVAVVVMIETHLSARHLCRDLHHHGRWPGDASTNVTFLIFRRALLSFDAAAWRRLGHCLPWCWPTSRRCS